MQTTAVPIEGGSLKTIPGPRDNFLVGSLFDAWKDPLSMFTRAARTYGDLVQFRFAWMRYFLVNEATAAHHVLIENAKGYHKSPNYQGLKVILGNGLLTSEGDLWRRQRKLAQPAFHREHLKGFANTMVAATRDTVKRWDGEVAGKGAFDLHAEMMRLTFRIVGQTLLGADLEADAKDFGAALNVGLKWANDYVESIVRVPPWVPTPNNVRFRKAQRTIEGVVGRVVAERKASSEEKRDLLGMLMGARDEATGEAMSDKLLMEELLTLTLAGHETTANALAFTFYLLSSHPEIARRANEEVERVLSGREPALEDLAKMPFIKAVIEEALRLYPPAWVVERVALEADEINGFKIPKGGIVGVSPFTMHRNPRYFENPEGFDPERWLKPDASRPKLAYMPFGGGPRTCIGNAFAMMELQIIVPMLLQRFQLSLVPGYKLELEPSVTLRPAKGIWMNARQASRPS
jgi:cytochrome P450